MSNQQRSALLKDKVKAAFNNTKGAYFFAATALVSNSAMAFTKPAAGAARNKWNKRGENVSYCKQIPLMPMTKT